MTEAIYSNHAVVAETETEVVIDFVLRTSGKPQHVARVVLPPLTAAKLGHLLVPQTAPEPVAEQVALELQKPKRSRRAKPKASSRQEG